MGDEWKCDRCVRDLLSILVWHVLYLSLSPSSSVTFMGNTFSFIIPRYIIPSTWVITTSMSHIFHVGLYKKTHLTLQTPDIDIH